MLLLIIKLPVESIDIIHFNYAVAECLLEVHRNNLVSHIRLRYSPKIICLISCKYYSSRIVFSFVQRVYTSIITARYY